MAKKSKSHTKKKSNSESATSTKTGAESKKPTAKKKSGADGNGKGAGRTYHGQDPTMMILFIIIGVGLLIAAYFLGYSVGSGGMSSLNTQTGSESTNKLVITTYSDFQCPYSKRFATDTYPKIKAKYGDQVEFVYKHFPLSFHANAQKAAEASECARDQGKFWEYHDVLFDTGKLTVADLKQHAADLGLDTETFNACLDSGEKAAKVQADISEGQQRGVRGTPSSWINGEMVVGALPFESFAPKIDAALRGEAPGDDAAAAPAAADEPAAAPTPSAPSVPKKSKPTVELFVMSECPFGLQMEKAYVPVAELLGSKADMEVKFVSYSMHGIAEIEENTRQYCIQKEQKDVWLDYLTCYIETKNSAACQESTGVDTDKMDACVDATNEEYGILDDYNDKSSWLSGRYPQYNLQKAENTKYGVRGSPTLVINGQTVSVNRAPEAVKQAVCAAFTNPPSECDETLSTAATAAGHGPIGATGGTAAPAAGCDA